MGISIRYSPMVLLRRKHLSLGWLGPVYLKYTAYVIAYDMPWSVLGDKMTQRSPNITCQIERGRKGAGKLPGHMPAQMLVHVHEHNTCQNRNSQIHFNDVTITVHYMIHVQPHARVHAGKHRNICQKKYMCMTYTYEANTNTRVGVYMQKQQREWFPEQTDLHIRIVSRPDSQSQCKKQRQGVNRLKQQL